MSRRRVMSLEDVWADRLGVESGEGVHDELQARFEHLSRFVLIGGMPAIGKAATAEAATAYGDLWILAGFLADAQRVIRREEGPR